MIITCPDCTTRYDVDDERFSPSGRSVRCSSCGESWFVPAPELIDVEPLPDKAPPKRKAAAKPQSAKSQSARAEPERAEREDIDREDEPRPARQRIKVGFADDADDRADSRRGDRENSDDRSFKSRAGKSRDERDEEDSRDYGGRSAFSTKSRRQDEVETDYADDDMDDEDDALFESPPPRPARGRDDDSDAPPADKGWRKGRQFIVEDEADEAERRPFFARKAKTKPVERETLRFADEDMRDDPDRTMRGQDDRSSQREFHVVDADWEDVGDHDERGRGFGRKVRAERRRATALARMEDVRPLDPVALDEEFFASLRVTPRELENAIRKARRRAEAREKNRLTPLRVIGWTAWLAAVIGAFYAVFFYRDDIVKMAPRAADAYAVIGIEANPYGLTIENVSHRLAMSTGGPTIEITGSLLNETAGSVKTPLLQAEALGPRGELLARWTFNAQEADVATGASVEFTTRAPAPEGVAEVALSFAPEKSVIESLMPTSK